MDNDLLFWTHILSEHAMFQANAFSYKEEKYIAEAENFNRLFSNYVQDGQNLSKTLLINWEKRLLKWL